MSFATTAREETEQQAGPASSLLLSPSLRRGTPKVRRPPKECRRLKRWPARSADASAQRRSSVNFWDKMFHVCARSALVDDRRARLIHAKFSILRGKSMQICRCTDDSGRRVATRSCHDWRRLSVLDTLSTVPAANAANAMCQICHGARRHYCGNITQPTASG